MLLFFCYGGAQLGPIILTDSSIIPYVANASQETVLGQLLSIMLVVHAEFMSAKPSELHERLPYVNTGESSQFLHYVTANYVDYRCISFRIQGTKLLVEKWEVLFLHIANFCHFLCLSLQEPNSWRFKNENEGPSGFNYLAWSFFFFSLQECLSFIMFNSPVSIPHLIEIFFRVGTFVFFLFHSLESSQYVIIMAVCNGKQPCKESNGSLN